MNESYTSETEGPDYSYECGKRVEVLLNLQAEEERQNNFQGL
jgi:hypothetical protein